MNSMDADCHYGDHHWNGSSICSNCGARLRCICGAYVREDNFEAHESRCRVLANLPNDGDEGEAA